MTEFDFRGGGELEQRYGGERVENKSYIKFCLEGTLANAVIQSDLAKLLFKKPTYNL